MNYFGFEVEFFYKFGKHMTLISCLLISDNTFICQGSNHGGMVGDLILILSENIGKGLENLSTNKSIWCGLIYNLLITFCIVPLHACVFYRFTMCPKKRKEVLTPVSNYLVSIKQIPCRAANICS